MTDKAQKAREALFEVLEDTHAVMLGADGAGPFMQPMAPQFDDDESGAHANAIWFFTKTDTDLAKAVISPSDAKMCVCSQSRETYACLSGALMVDRNEQKIEKFWSPTVAAWFDDGKDDPKLTMLRFVPDKAAVWVSEAGAAKFGFEIAKANLANTTPDLGYHEVISL